MTKATRFDQEAVMEATTKPKWRCVIDRNVMNPPTVKDMMDIGSLIFAPLCSRNRGAFVLDPTDYEAFSCCMFSCYLICCLAFCLFLPKLTQVIYLVIEKIKFFVKAEI